MVERILRPTAEEDVEDGEDEASFVLKPFYYYPQPITRQIHHYYISSAIGDPHLYVDLVHKLATATPDEAIYIHLNCIGGNLATGVQLINAMRQTQAHIIVSVESEAYSLATLLFLAADEWIVHDNCLFMFHDFSGWTGGKGHEQKSSLDATLRWYRDLTISLYRPFLTEDELERVLKGEDIYLHSPEVRTRLAKMVKHMQRERKEAEQKAEEKAQKALEAAEKRAAKKAATTPDVDVANTPST